MKPNGTSKTNLQNENATHTRNEGREGKREKGIEQAARAKWQTEDSGSNGSDGSIPTVFVWRFACHRVATCPLCLAQPPPLTPQLLPPSANPSPANSFAVAVDACFIYCFFNPFLVDLLSLSFLLVRSALLRRPSSPFVLASISVHWWPTTPPQLVVSPFPPTTFPASSSFGDWQVSLLRAAIQRSLNELDSIRNASILRWPRKFLPFLPLTPYPLHPS